jgi:hypothetical protein
MNPLTYSELESSISEFLKDCKSIRADRQKDYNFHFMDNYNKYGLKGFLINDGEITARLEQIEKSGTDYKDLEKSLRNILYDGINYRLLLLFWLQREKFGSSRTFDSPYGGYIGPYNTTQVKSFLPTMDSALKSTQEYIEDIIAHVDFDGVRVGQRIVLLPGLCGIYLGDCVKWHFKANLTTLEGKLDCVYGITELP